MTATPPTFDDVLAAAGRIEPGIRRTPVVNARRFDQEAGCRVYFKCENLQRAGAFKMRGATNAVACLSASEAHAGVATHSSGNHGAALAAAAQARGIRAWIVVPENAAPAKLANIRSFGPEIVSCKPGLSNRENTLSQVVKETGATVVHPYDDPAVIAGQGTATLELLEDEPGLDTLLVPVGGGGLISGALLVAATLRPTLRVIGVEPAGADDALRSLASGERVMMDNPQTIADGLRASLGVINFEIMLSNQVEIVTVSDEQIETARARMQEWLAQPVEPSSATVGAALLYGKVSDPGDHVGAIISGGNVPD